MESIQNKESVEFALIW